MRFSDLFKFSWWILNSNYDVDIIISLFDGRQKFKTNDFTSWIEKSCQLLPMNFFYEKFIVLCSRSQAMCFHAKIIFKAVFLHKIIVFLFIVRNTSRINVKHKRNMCSYPTFFPCYFIHIWTVLKDFPLENVLTKMCLTCSCNFFSFPPNKYNS